MELQPPDANIPSMKGPEPPISTEAAKQPIPVAPQQAGELRARAPVTRGWFGTKLHNAYVWLLGHLSGWLVRHVVSLNMIKELSRDDVKALPPDWVDKLTDRQFGHLSADVIPALSANSLVLWTGGEHPKNRIYALTTEQIKAISEVQFNAMNDINRFFKSQLQQRLTPVISPGPPGSTANDLQQRVESAVQHVMPPAKESVENVLNLSRMPIEDFLKLPALEQERLAPSLSEDQRRALVKTFYGIVDNRVEVNTFNLMPWRIQLLRASDLQALAQTEFGFLITSSHDWISHVKPEVFAEACDKMQLHMELLKYPAVLKHVTSAQIAAIPPEAFMKACQEKQFHHSLSDQQLNALTLPQLKAVNFNLYFGWRRNISCPSRDEMNAMSPEELRAIPIFQLTQADIYGCNPQQLLHLTTLQWSAIELDRLSPEFLPSIPPEAIAASRGARFQASRFLNALRPPQLVVLQPHQLATYFQDVAPEALASLSKNTVNAIPATSVITFDERQTAALRAKWGGPQDPLTWPIPAWQIRLLTAEQLNTLDLKLWSPEQIVLLTQQQVSGIAPNKIVDLSSKMELVYPLVRHLNAPQIQALSPPVVSHLAGRGHLRGVQFEFVTAAQAETLFAHGDLDLVSPEELQKLITRFGGAPPPETLKNMSVDEILKIAPWRMACLDAAQLNALTDAHILALLDRQYPAHLLLPNLTEERVRTMSSPLLFRLGPEMALHVLRSALTDAQAKEVVPNDEFAAIPSAQIPTQSQEKINENIRQLRTDQIRALTVEQVRGMGEQAARLNPVQVKALSPQQKEVIPIDVWRRMVTACQLLANEFAAHPLALLEPPGRLEALPYHLLYGVAVNSAMKPLWDALSTDRRKAIAARLFPDDWLRRGEDTVPLRWMKELHPGLLKEAVLNLSPEHREAALQRVRDLNRRSITGLTVPEVLLLMTTDSRPQLITQIGEDEIPENRIAAVFMMLTPEELFAELSSMPHHLQEDLTQYASREQIKYLRAQVEGLMEASAADGSRKIRIPPEELTLISTGFAALKQKISLFDPKTGTLEALDSLQKESRDIDQRIAGWRNKIQALTTISRALSLPIPEDLATDNKMLSDVYQELTSSLRQSLTEYRSTVMARLEEAGQLPKASAEDAEANVDYAASILAGYFGKPKDFTDEIPALRGRGLYDWNDIQKWLEDKEAGPGLATELDLEKQGITDRKSFLDWYHKHFPE